jgi:hypothetical protein
MLQAFSMKPRKNQENQGEDTHAGCFFLPEKDVGCRVAKYMKNARYVLSTCN